MPFHLLLQFKSNGLKIRKKKSYLIKPVNMKTHFHDFPFEMLEFNFLPFSYPKFET